MARKSVSFGQLLEYFNTPEKVGPALLSNLQARQDELAAIRAEFNTNAHLLPPRKNGNILYHEILSFGAADGELLTTEMLEDLTRRYLELRAPYALAYAKAHFDTDCPHVHLLISANNVGSHQRLRLSKQRFHELKRELERYQKERYPFLVNSLTQQARSRPGIRETRPEQERRRRGDKTVSRKETIRETVAGEVAVAPSAADCYRRLLQRGLRLYRRGKTVGVEDLEECRRYRLKTLGLAETFEASLAAWRRVPERLESVQKRSHLPQRSRQPERDR